MTVLHIREQGAQVGREVERIQITKPALKSPMQITDKKSAVMKAAKPVLLHEVPIQELEQLVLYGNVQVTTQAVGLLLEHNVDVLFLSSRGRYRGRLGKDGSKLARLRHAQLKQSDDDAQLLQIAKAIVAAKLANQQYLLLRFARGGAGITATPWQPKQQQTLTAAAQGITQMAQASRNASDTDALRGYEGKAGAYYFGALKTLITPAWSFRAREYHPPPDPVNALLSFGYARLLNDITATVHLVGLDPYLGCFHALGYNRPSLALDLMEEFRPLVVDAIVFPWIWRGEITPDAFTFTGRKERPVILAEKLIPLLLAAYEERVNEVVPYTPEGNRQKLRNCFELQVRQYARLIHGSRREYVGLVVE